MSIQNEEKKCNICEHGRCKTCGCCHNSECEVFSEPVKMCFNSLIPPNASRTGDEGVVKHVCCDGECNHDDCCGKVEENCPFYVNPDVLKKGIIGKFEVTSDLSPTEESFEERFSKFVPLVPGFSTLRDYTKELPGMTYNYLNLESFIKQEIEKAYEEGYTEGYNQGENKGYSKGLKIGRAEGGPGEVITNR